MPLTTKDAAGLIAGGVSKGENMAREQAEQKKGRYEVLVGFCVGNGENAFPGDVIELTDFEARRYSNPDDPWIKPTTKEVGAAKPDPNHRKAIKSRDPKGVRNQDPT